MSDASVPAIAIHGGAWAIPDDLAEASVAGVKRAAVTGFKILSSGGTALDAVEAAVRVLEDDPAFDAGTGSVLTSEGEVEMDALIMDGETLKAGAVGCVKNIKNPVSLARLIMDKTPHVVLVGPGANKFAEECGIAFVPTAELISGEARTEYEKFKKYKTAVNTLFSSRDKTGHDTVGAVAVDVNGHVACATSTGGITAKMPGRVGDTPILGAGGYADDGAGAVSTTGHGEGITRVCLAKHATDLMNSGTSCQEAADRALSNMEERIGSAGGMVAVTPKGEVAHSFTTDRMAWAWTRGGEIHFGLTPSEENVTKLSG